MLFVYHGTDTNKVADRAHALVRTLQQRRPGAQVFTFEGALQEPQQFDELIEARGLFEEKHILLLKTPFETAEGRDTLLARAPACAATQNIVVVIEGKLAAAHKRELEQYAEKIEEHAAASTRYEGFNIFSLGDALGTRNRRSLWVGYHMARRSGAEIASIHGTLHWAVKSMLIANSARSANDAGQKPNVYGKFKRYAANYTPEELCTLSHALVALYHESRHGTYPLDTALEYWILNDGTVPS